MAKPTHIFTLTIILLAAALGISAQQIKQGDPNFGNQCSSPGTVPFANAQATVPAQGGIVQFYNTPVNCDFEYEPGGGIVTNFRETNDLLVETTIAANDTNLPRSGTLLIEGTNYEFTVNQTADDCTYELDQGRIRILNDETSGSFSMTTQPGCEWKAYAANTKIGLNGQEPLTIIEGTGSTTIDFQIEANNSGSNRTLDIIIAGLKQEVRQVEMFCEYTNPRNFFYAPKEGITYRFNVELTEGCEWNAYEVLPVRDWLTIAADDSGEGFVEVTLTVAPNDGDQVRDARAVFFSVDTSETDDYEIFQSGQQQVSNTEYNFADTRFLDPVIYRPSEGNWYVDSTDLDYVSKFGTDSDLIAPADYDGDGFTDFAVFRPANGTWYIQFTRFTFFGSIEEFEYRTTQFGTAGDIPVPADFDGDGKADLTVYRPSEGNWYTLRSTDGEFSVTRFGIAEDKPLRGDFDGDQIADVAVWRPSNGVWYMLLSETGSFRSYEFGVSDDIPVPADYDYDGKADLAVYRPDEGKWYRLFSSDDGFTRVTQFGLPTDIPIPADYDADGQTDIAVFRPAEGDWYILQSTAGFKAFHYGTNGDIPIPGAYNQQ